MEEISIIFTYNGINTIIQSRLEDKLKYIIEKLEKKIEINKNKILLLYNGNSLNIEIDIKNIISNNDLNKNEMNIVIYNKDEKNENKIKSNEIICPECKENIFIKLEDYKIILYI